ncbi:hypothetical protein GT347_11765 [Xylophilus rhododendri]|uniref:Uncharacterized protein n=1 Tax=Xylophilus rhododendri TaxID=2697032 RepID=A0A857J727_9BURK|nr:hypothetical protein [Xylophilus rhododendri]QHI98615.1 hypothetical protein GT347_11765 [Xylophilus rhododendri]
MPSIKPPWPGLALAFLAHAACAAPSGSISTIYEGALPADAKWLCTEDSPCAVTGVKEVWYGRYTNWRYRQLTGGFRCGNELFTDPIGGVKKDCFVRDTTESTLLPPRLAVLPVTIELNDLATVEAGRYSVDLVVGMQRIALKAPHFEGTLGSLGLATDPSMTQDYFQFNIVDSKPPTRQYSLFIAATQERCTSFRRMGDGSMAMSMGRFMDIYSIITEPATGFIPQRSEMQRLCTNDRGQLAFYLHSPSIDAFRIKVVSHGIAGKANDVFDLYIPTALNAVYTQ